MISEEEKKIKEIIENYDYKKVIEENKERQEKELKKYWLYKTILFTSYIVVLIGLLIFECVILIMEVKQ